MSVHGTVGYGIAVCFLADFPDIEVAGFGQSAAYYDALRAEDVDESGDAVSQEIAMLVQALRCQLVSFFVEAYDKLSVDFLARKRDARFCGTLAETAYQRKWRRNVPDNPQSRMRRVRRWR